MPNENDLNLDLNLIADLTPTRPQEDVHAGQGDLPGELPEAPHLQTVHPGKHLSAEQVEHLMGDEAAESQSVETNRELERREGIDPDAQS
ncbi:hypothetical protein [Deinococcus rubellus]|uniref:Uncharacterized protein n=1 Tax=Deinococcus rubellus TaxID=1889240 RepID=A0ABY5YK56_9DEIO|nr:hypothetical protein [Deinococcus rubellus]UWX64644.1 hypothetical protein N0D28_02990 [Deinococcus rubellus]